MARTTWNSAAAQAILDGQGGTRALLHTKAQAVLAAARDSAPVDTGEYRNGLHVAEAHTDRLVVRVVASDRKGFILEAKYGILSSALDAAGGS